MNLLSRDRILLIDDMPSIHEDFRGILTPDTASSGLSEVEHQLFGVQETAPPPAFVLDCAIGGEEGLELLKSAHLEGRPYALAFVDMRMPAGWDGMRTIEELWAVDAQLQVVICTAYSDEPLGQALPRLGSPDKLVVLKKPFDPIEVTQLARALVSKWRLERQAADHLASLNRTMRELQDGATELARSNRELEQFAYVASRDLSEPLRIMTGYAQLLLKRYKHQLDDDAREFMGFIVDGAKRMRRLIDDLLSYSRLGRDRVQMGTHSLDHALDAALGNLGLILEDTGAVIDRPGPLPTLRCNLTAMTQVFQNLVGNALKFRREDPPLVRIAAQADEFGWTISIADNGIGISPQHFDRLFVIFTRLHARTKYDGTGTGLAICKKIVEQHGGRIWIESIPGEGSCFKFSLPEASAAPSARAGPSR